MKQTENVKT